MIAVGATPDRALALAVEVEALAQMYLQALAVAEPAQLSDAEIGVVIAKFAHYGSPRRS